MLGLTSEMKVKVVSEEGCLQTFSVELPVAKVKEKIEEAFKNVQNQAKLPGFRPGKAPLDMVRENFKMAAYERAQDLLMREGVSEVLKSKKINPVQTPVVQDAKFLPEKPFQFQFQVEIAPQIKPTNYKGLKLTRKAVAVGDAELAKSLANLADMNARLVESKDDTLKPTHYAVVNYEGFLDGKAIDGAKAENFLLDMSAPQAIAGLAEGLVGSKVSEERDVKVQFPADSPAKELAGKEAVFKVTLIGIKEKNVPVLDDEFAKDLGLDSLATLKTKLRENLEREQKQASQADVEKQIIEKLLEEHQFAVPPSLAKGQLQSLVQRQSSRLLQQGVPQAEVDKALAKATPELQKQAEKDIRLAYILNAIANEESIDVSDEEISAKINDIVSKSEEKQRGSLEKALRAKYNDQLRSEIRESKIFVWIIEHAKIKEA